MLFTKRAAYSDTRGEGLRTREWNRPREGSPETRDETPRMSFRMYP
jgi:hypothetical protein